MIGLCAGPNTPVRRIQSRYLMRRSTCRSRCQSENQTYLQSTFAVWGTPSLQRRIRYRRFWRDSNPTLARLPSAKHAQILVLPSCADAMMDSVNGSRSSREQVYLQIVGVSSLSLQQCHRIWHGNQTQHANIMQAQGIQTYLKPITTCQTVG